MFLWKSVGYKTPTQNYCTFLVHPGIDPAALEKHTKTFLKHSIAPIPVLLPVMHYISPLHSKLKITDSTFLGLLSQHKCGLILLSGSRGISHTVDYLTFGFLNYMQNFTD